MRKLLLKDLITQEDIKITILDSQILHKYKKFDDLTDQENEDYLYYSRNESYETLKDLNQKLADMEDDFI